MTLVTNSTMNGTLQQNESIEVQEREQSMEKGVKLIKSNTVKDVSPMPDYLKKRVGENAPVMSELFEDVIKQKGEIANLEKVDGHTFRIDDISALALHSFIIKAQEYGMDVTYKKETTITIS